MSRDASPSRPILDALLNISDEAECFAMLIPSKNLTEWSHEVLWTWSRASCAERELETEDVALQKEAQRLWDNIFENDVWSGLILRNSATIEKPCRFYEIVLL
jgi:hypothetical protein